MCVRLLSLFGYRADGAAANSCAADHTFHVQVTLFCAGHTLSESNHGCAFCPLGQSTSSSNRKLEGTHERLLLLSVFPGAGLRLSCNLAT
eukprot:364661-Chlamydomonas_euryale.AAC.7